MDEAERAFLPMRIQILERVQEAPVGGIERSLRACTHLCAGGSDEVVLDRPFSGGVTRGHTGYQCEEGDGEDADPRRAAVWT